MPSTENLHNCGLPRRPVGPDHSMVSLVTARACSIKRRATRLRLRFFSVMLGPPRPGHRLCLVFGGSQAADPGRWCGAGAGQVPMELSSSKRISGLRTRSALRLPAPRTMLPWWPSSGRLEPVEIRPARMVATTSRRPVDVRSTHSGGKVGRRSCSLSISAAGPAAPLRPQRAQRCRRLLRTDGHRCPWSSPWWSDRAWSARSWAGARNRRPCGG